MVPANVSLFTMVLRFRSLFLLMVNFSSPVPVWTTRRMSQWGDRRKASDSDINIAGSHKYACVWSSITGRQINWQTRASGQGKNSMESGKVAGFYKWFNMVSLQDAFSPMNLVDFLNLISSSTSVFFFGKFLRQCFKLSDLKDLAKHSSKWSWIMNNDTFSPQIYYIYYFKY